MRLGFKNALSGLRKWGKNAKDRITTLGQKISDNKKLIGLIGGLLLSTAGAGAGAYYYDKQGKKVQGDIDKLRAEQEAKKLYDMFPSVPTTIHQHQPPPPTKIPTDIWG